MAAVRSGVLRQSTTDQLLPEPSSSFSGSGVDEPWAWLSEEEDDETRSYLAWFEAQVEDAYASQAKIQTRAVDMDWCTRHPEWRGATKSGVAATESDTGAGEEDSINVVDASAVPPLQARECGGDSRAGAGGTPPLDAKVVLAHGQPSPPQAPHDHSARRPQLRRSSAPGVGDASRVGLEQEGEEEAEVRQASQERPEAPVPPRAAQQTSLAERGQMPPMRSSVGGSTSSSQTGIMKRHETKREGEETEVRQQQHQQQAMVSPRFMAGSPAPALRKVAGRSGDSAPVNTASPAVEEQG